MKNEKGFTFLEFIVALFITGIFAIMVTFHFSFYQNKIYLESQKSDCRLAASLLELYQVDHGKYPDNSGRISEHASPPYDNFKTSPHNSIVWHIENGATIIIVKVSSSKTNKTATYTTNTGAPFVITKNI